MAVYHAVWSVGVVPCLPRTGYARHDYRLSRILLRAGGQPSRVRDSGEEHLRWVQKAQAGHHQPAFRLRDRVEGPSDVLDPNKGDLDDLPDVNFRIDKAAGRVLWDYRGETYTKHFYPPNLRNLEFTPDSMIGEMDYAGIDKVLLHTNAMLGTEQRVPSGVRRAVPRPHPVDGAVG